MKTSPVGISPKLQATGATTVPRSAARGQSPRPTWRLTRHGLQVDATGGLSLAPPERNAPVPPIDDEQAWFESTRELLRTPGLLTDTDGGVDLLVDDGLTLPGVLHGDLWRLSRAQLQDAAAAWFAQQATGVGWQVAVVRQSDGRHALIAAMPRTVLNGTLGALQDAGVRIGRVMPRWGLALSTMESNSTGVGREPAVFTAVWSGLDHQALVARRVMGVWQAVEPEPLDLRQGQPTDAGVERLLIREPLPGVPTVAASAYSASALDFVTPPAARATASARTALALAVAALATVTVATGLDAVARHESRSNLMRMDASAPAGRSDNADLAQSTPASSSTQLPAPLPPDRAAALQAELSSPWLPVLDQLADRRPAQIRLQRIEPVAGAGTGSLRVNVTAQAPEAADALAWVRKLSQEPQLRDPRLLGWQREAEGGRVSFQLEVASGRAP